MAACVLIVDDDPVQRRLLENMIRRFGYEPLLADGGEMALALLAGPQARPIDCVVLDLAMPDLDGHAVLARMRQDGLSPPVIVQTAHGGIENVVSVMRAGASDFVVKPVGPERLQVSLQNVLATSALAGELQRIKRSREGTLGFGDIVTRSPVMQAVLRSAEKAAGSTIPVLIEGESGVGKELIARAVHGSGARREKPFVAVNCGAIPDNLVESILFGHERGAFTGATERHVGKFVEASGGTLFLDEVGELPAAAQVKLLRALQENEVEPVGARRPVRTDVRVVSATNRNLIDEVKAGRFREDLFYRLHVYPIAVPPLRERPEDIAPLARHFLARFAAEEGKRIRVLAAEALALLGAYGWPGNVRQLENALFRAVVMAETDEIGVGEFPQIVAQMPGAVAAEAMPLLVEPYVALAPAAPEPPAPRDRQAAEANTAGPLNAMLVLDDQGEVRPMEEIEVEVIRFAVAHYQGRMSEVARRLRIGRSTLYRKLEALQITPSGTESNDDPVAAG